tara:strand:- start:68 stop:442 length:375 start_codon:yes stop_codon:yes gene_type:complete
MTVNAIEENTEQSREHQFLVERGIDQDRDRIESLADLLVQQVLIGRKVRRKRSWSMAQIAVATSEIKSQIRALTWAIEQAGREADDPQWEDPIPCALKNLRYSDRLIKDTIGIVKRLKAQEVTS